MIFVNAYTVTQGYGGPEEGGWWFDVGEVLASVPVDSQAEAEVVKARLLERFADQATDRPRSSAAGDGIDLEVYFQEQVGRDYPDVRPHYE